MVAGGDIRSLSWPVFTETFFFIFMNRMRTWNLMPFLKPAYSETTCIGYITIYTVDISLRPKAEDGNFAKRIGLEWKGGARIGWHAKRVGVSPSILYNYDYTTVTM